MTTTLSSRVVSWLKTAIWISCAVATGHSSNLSSWPSFYTGQSSHPTQSILSSLLEYQDKWHHIQMSEDFDRTYTFTMAWEYSTISTDPCYQANQFIHVDDDEVVSVTTSVENDPVAIASCEGVNRTRQLLEYKTIDELFEMVIHWVESALDGDTSEYLIITLMMDRHFYFPTRVKLSEHSNFIAWKIECFAPGHIEHEQDVCEIPTTQQQEVFGVWVWMFLYSPFPLLMCPLYISYLPY